MNGRRDNEYYVARLERDAAFDEAMTGKHGRPSKDTEKSDNVTLLPSDDRGTSKSYTLRRLKLVRVLCLRPAGVQEGTSRLLHPGESAQKEIGCSGIHI